MAAAAPLIREVQEKLDEQKAKSLDALPQGKKIYEYPTALFLGEVKASWPQYVPLRLTSDLGFYRLAFMQTTSRDEDFQAWLIDQAKALHARRFYSLDLDALAEELEDMAARDKRELRTRLRNLLLHLLKWKYQPDHRTSSWRRTINNERDEIADFLKYSPSLITELRTSFDEMYQRARRDTTDLLRGAAKAAIPDTSPWTLETVQDPDFWPDSAPAPVSNAPHS